MKAAVLIVGLLGSAAAAADVTFDSTGSRVYQAPIAALYVQVPLGTRAKAYSGPVFGLRLQQTPLAQLNVSPWDRRQSRTIFDVPFRFRQDDPLKDSGALNALGTGAIVGIVVGGVAAIAVLADDDDDGSGGGY
jgi:hypothetical protein